MLEALGVDAVLGLFDESHLGWIGMMSERNKEEQHAHARGEAVPWDLEAVLDPQGDRSGIGRRSGDADLIEAGDEVAQGTLDLIEALPVLSEQIVQEGETSCGYLEQ